MKLSKMKIDLSIVTIVLVVVVLALSLVLLYKQNEGYQGMCDNPKNVLEADKCIELKKLKIQEERMQKIKQQQPQPTPIVAHHMSPKPTPIVTQSMSPQSMQ